jgi:hypothetical protein
MGASEGVGGVSSLDFQEKIENEIYQVLKQEIEIIFFH